MQLSPRFKAILRVVFSDIEEHVPLPAHRLFAVEHAKSIVEFLRKWRDVDQIVVHCTAGMSRSPAVALGIGELQGWPMEALEKQHPLRRKMRQRGKNGD